MSITSCTNPQDDVAANPETTQSYWVLYVKYHYLIMDCPPKTYWHEKSDTVLSIMKDNGIPGDSRCGAIKVLMGIDLWLEDGI